MAQIGASAWVLGFPLVVKGVLHGAYLASSLEEATVYFQKIRARWGLPIIVQQYIEGEEYDVISLGGRESKIMGMVGMRKLRITDKGKAWAGLTIWDEELFNLARDIMKQLWWVGPMEMEFIKQSSSEEYHLIEINPRFPAWVYLAAEAGQNLPLAVAQIAMGEEVEPFTSYQTGLIFVRHAVDLICPISYLEDLTIEGQLILGKEGKNRKGLIYHEDQGVLRETCNLKAFDGADEQVR